MNVLIVEDNPISSKVLEITLENHGYTIITARDGAQAIEKLERQPEIDLMIMDIVMPNTNGFELHKTLMAREDWKEIPIIVCTSMKPAEIAAASMQVEGWQYLLKPIKAESLIQKVKLATAKRLPFLQSADFTMARLGLDAQSLLDLMDEFLKVVGEKIGQLENRETRSAPLEFQDLLEGAKVLGAERIIHVLDRFDRTKAFQDSATDEALYLLLLRELKGLRHYLDTYVSKDPAQLKNEMAAIRRRESASVSNGGMIPWESLELPKNAASGK